MEHPVILDTGLKKCKNYYGYATILGKPYHTAYMPLRDINNNISGMLFIGKEAGVINSLIFQLAIYQNIVLVILGAVFIVFFYFFINKLLTRRLKTINDRLKDIAEGEGDLTVSVYILARDELGDLAGNFNKFVK
jgi:methyl-accepting chemotaxis protein